MSLFCSIHLPQSHSKAVHRNSRPLWTERGTKPKVAANNMTNPRKLYWKASWVMPSIYNGHGSGCLVIPCPPRVYILSKILENVLHLKGATFIFCFCFSFDSSTEIRHKSPIDTSKWRGCERRETNNWIWTYKSYLIDVKIIPSSSLQANSFIMYTAEHF